MIVVKNFIIFIFFLIFLSIFDDNISINVIANDI